MCACKMTQGHKGTRHWYTSNHDKQNYPLCKLQLMFKGLDTQLNKQTIRIQESPQGCKSMNKKLLL